MGRLIGYARVSTSDQDMRLQLDALRDVGCHDEQVFLDRASGARTARPGLDACLQALGPGDTLIIWRLDRLGRSMAHLVTLIIEEFSFFRPPEIPITPGPTRSLSTTR